jgi:hypothetical protein
MPGSKAPRAWRPGAAIIQVVTGEESSEASSVAFEAFLPTDYRTAVGRTRRSGRLFPIKRVLALAFHRRRNDWGAAGDGDTAAGHRSAGLLPGDADRKVGAACGGVAGSPTPLGALIGGIVGSVVGIVCERSADCGAGGVDGIPRPASTPVYRCPLFGAVHRRCGHNPQPGGGNRRRHGKKTAAGVKPTAAIIDALGIS